jgi:hypothetical protein
MAGSSLAVSIMTWPEGNRRLPATIAHRAIAAQGGDGELGIAEAAFAVWTDDFVQRRSTSESIKARFISI